MAETIQEPTVFKINFSRATRCSMRVIQKKRAELKLKWGNRYVSYSDAMNALFKELDENECNEG